MGFLCNQDKGITSSFGLIAQSSQNITFPSIHPYILTFLKKCKGHCPLYQILNNKGNFLPFNCGWKTNTSLYSCFISVTLISNHLKFIGLNNEEQRELYVLLWLHETMWPIKQYDQEQASCIFPHSLAWFIFISPPSPLVPPCPKSIHHSLVHSVLHDIIIRVRPFTLISVQTDQSVTLWLWPLCLDVHAMAKSLSAVFLLNLHGTV